MVCVRVREERQRAKDLLPAMATRRRSQHTNSGAAGQARLGVDDEGEALREWLKSLGITMKELKERAAAQLQLALGFWWEF